MQCKRAGREKKKRTREKVRARVCRREPRGASGERAAMCVQKTENELRSDTRCICIITCAPHRAGCGGIFSFSCFSCSALKLLQRVMRNCFVREARGCSASLLPIFGGQPSSWELCTECGIILRRFNILEMR